MPRTLRRGLFAAGGLCCVDAAACYLGTFDEAHENQTFFQSSRLKDAAERLYGAIQFQLMYGLTPAIALMYARKPPPSA